MLAVPLLAVPVPKSARPALAGPNANSVLKEFRGRLTAESSTTWGGYDPSKLVDGDDKTVWYSAGGDAPMAGQKPWVKLTFPADAMVRRVTVLGTRDPSYPNGYFVLAGKLEILGTGDKVLAEYDMKGEGEKYDFDCMLPTTAYGVKAIRFTATEDQKTHNCVALSEIQVD
jgi:hypothetical protein